jgi:hypothetical protein
VLGRRRSPSPAAAHATFWGAFFHKRNLGRFRFDAYTFGLDEDEHTSSQRKYTTLGTRWFKSPATGEVDFQIESAWQFGTYRGLDHFAHYQHAELGYLVDAPWAPRFVFQYDYGSGDDNPDDDKHGGFSHLFGARRGDYNPTGIYTPYYRPNLQTPGVRLHLTPSSQVDAMAVFRTFWLAHSRDAWAGSGLQDPTGSSGTFLGNQIETRLRWRALPQTTFEVGWAHMFKGSYLKQVPESPQTGDSDYFYFSVELRLRILPFSEGR